MRGNSARLAPINSSIFSKNVALANTAEQYHRVRRREGIGIGDAKLMAAAGAWVGWQGLSSVLLIAAAVGLAVAFAARGRGPAPQDEVSFGPFLALGLWLTWLYGPLVFG